MSASGESVMSGLKRALFQDCIYDACPDCGVEFGSAMEKSRHQKKCACSAPSLHSSRMNLHSAGEGKIKPAKRHRSASAPDLDFSFLEANSPPPSPSLPVLGRSPSPLPPSPPERDAKAASPEPAKSLLDRLVDSVPEHLQKLAKSLQADFSPFQTLYEDYSSTTPVDNTTEFLLFLLTRCFGAMTREKEDMLLLVLHHPEFRLSDVPKTSRRFDEINASLPLVKPGMSSDSRPVYFGCAEPFTVNQTITTRVARKAGSEGKQPKSTVKTRPTTVYYLSPLKKIEQLHADPQRRL